MIRLLSILGIIGIFFVLSILFCIYDLKKGQIKMRDNEIPVEKVHFRRSNILWIN